MKRPLSTVIYTHGGGRFGNQLLRFLHWLAWVREMDGRVDLVNMAFWPYAEYFATWSAHPGCAYPLRPGWVDRAASARRLVPGRFREGFDWRMQRWSSMAARLLRLRNVATVDVVPGSSLCLDADERVSRMLAQRTTVCSGWQITHWSGLERQAEGLRALFTPAQPYATRSSEFLRGCRQRYDLLIGMLVRHGDYRSWKAGRYFFPVESYVRWARELVHIHAGCRVGIVIACDELQPESAFVGLPVVFATGCVNRGGPWFESFLELAGCDLVVSPPSTFSACAAFLGNRPIMPLRAPDQFLDRGDTLADHLFGAARDCDFTNAVQ